MKQKQRENENVRLRTLKTLPGVLIAFACIGWAGLAWAADSDADGIADATDNCTAVANADQLDADADGFGDRCDADYDNDGTVGDADYAILISAFGSVDGETDFVAAADHDADGVIAGTDVGFQRGRIGLAVGPSGLACADPTGATAPCLP